MDELIAELKERKAAASLYADDSLLGGLAPPLSLSEIELAEASLGFKLPDSLRRIYSEVANGGFGYSYGLLGLNGGPRNEDGQDAVGLYMTYRESDPDDPLWQWPFGLLPIGHLGCAMFHCIDCSDPAGAVVWFEPNPHEPGQSWSDSFIPFAPSLVTYFQAWLDGKDLFEVFADGT
ncbi:SMI1/KNR4 family protein [Pseudoxanthomonas sp. CF125]|jgi:hypothetical protein|uniref:SMI1/KNR4 family protein n=1 Tax=Pseudoxanthomonas sp. CF125 TaxID=1855303 RepID=UPI00088C3F05|nr:SMI1/KNR4 family protein [Pseudoxanthomonas sp. CF125]SDQ85813.1 SMI1 / KNR4 family (SUKH-1) [Pseudoxanthomonas sp. CF125]